MDEMDGFDILYYMARVEPEDWKIRAALIRTFDIIEQGIKDDKVDTGFSQELVLDIIQTIMYIHIHYVTQDDLDAERESEEDQVQKFMDQLGLIPETKEEEGGEEGAV